MPPSRHPSPQTLANLLIGDCSPGAAYLVTRHVEACPQCSSRLRAMGAATGEARDIRCDPPEMLDRGIEIARVRHVSGLGEVVLHLRIEAGERLRLGELLPVAEILVLEGSFNGDGEPYAAGDFLSLEERPAAELFSEAGGACLITCLDPSGLTAI